MKPLPLPLRVAAGAAATAAEHARELPARLAGLPVTVVSQALQLSMRMQQHVTELAIRGDDVLAGLRPVEDAPSWATFDEDGYADMAESDELASEPGAMQPRDAGLGAAGNGRHPDFPELSDFTAEQPPSAEPTDPWSLEEQALAAEHLDGEFDSEPPTDTDYPAGLADYATMTLPQLRARLRTFSLAQLEEILAHERANTNRPSFTGMLTRRINNVRNEQ
ncbi:hypothetical protein EV191_101220 [Tamaricihabitans halophyticus]|uniref:Lipid droplet-associated protein n=1 Tax=Tamaricihabitans halophyticus TaxID=1262583 RepID=A0A4R2R3J2_9PSEU|nr:lipid droplet-associated protein [Tamaricihabitans halophyticus]TCP56279.1 hypothetical protein EV191_101220 [Tamaricihabitans halophyticus]